MYIYISPPPSLEVDLGVAPGHLAVVELDPHRAHLGLELVRFVVVALALGRRARLQQK